MAERLVVSWQGAVAPRRPSRNALANGKSIRTVSCLTGSPRITLTWLRRMYHPSMMFTVAPPAARYLPRACPETSGPSRPGRCLHGEGWLSNPRGSRNLSTGSRRAANRNLPSCNRDPALVGLPTATSAAGCAQAASRPGQCLGKAVFLCVPLRAEAATPHPYRIRGQRPPAEGTPIRPRPPARNHRLLPSRRPPPPRPPPPPPHPRPPPPPPPVPGGPRRPAPRGGGGWPDRGRAEGGEE